MMFSAMLIDAFHDCDTGFPSRYRFDVKLFKLRRKTMVQTDLLDELFYVDDMAKNANLEAKMQEVMDLVSQPCDNWKVVQ